MTSALETISSVCGWVYFLCWSVSLYPQLYLNWRRKTTFGVSTDFIVFNLYGFFFYCIYNNVLFFNEQIRSEYRLQYGSDPLVAINDVVFSIHMFLLSILLAIQAIYYTKFAPSSNSAHLPSGARNGFQRLSSAEFAEIGFNEKSVNKNINIDNGNVNVKNNDDDEEEVLSIADDEIASSLPRISFPSILFLFSTLVVAIVLAILCLLGQFTWLNWIFTISMIKLLATLFKCCPQLYLNYRYKSTAGWSTENAVLDLVGGFLSFMQLGIDSYLAGDVQRIVGNPGKLFLSIISIFIDVAFLIQRYCLYAGNGDPWTAVS